VSVLRCAAAGVLQRRVEHGQSRPLRRLLVEDGYNRGLPEQPGSPAADTGVVQLRTGQLRGMQEGFPQVPHHKEVHATKNHVRNTVKNYVRNVRNNVRIMSVIIMSEIQ
jgi:hypothetical protein